MLKKIKFSDTDKTMHRNNLEAIPTRMQSLKKFHQRELKKLQKKEEKCHGNNLQKVKQQHKCDCENVTNLAAEFPEHKSQGKKLGFLKHFSPI